MLQNKAYAAYANNKIMTASPAELTLMLYDGAIKFCNIAIMAVEKEDIQQAHTNIRKVERIIEEFQSTLDDKYPVSKDFNNVYTYLHRRLVEANIKIEELMEDLKKKYTVVVVTHNMQQAVRVSDDTAFFLVGDMVEFGDTKTIFSYPQDKRTEDYITGRFG